MVRGSKRYLLRDFSAAEGRLKGRLSRKQVRCVRELLGVETSEQKLLTFSGDVWVWLQGNVVTEVV